MKIINKIHLILPLVFIYSCTTLTTSIRPSRHYMAVNHQINLGQSFSGWKEENGYILIPYNNLIKGINVFYDGIEYTLGISDNQTIVFISTNDKLFSVNGFKVGDEIKTSKARTIPGWGNYVNVNEEWYAAWMPMNNNENEKKGKIQWFFKFDFENDKGAYPPVEGGSSGALNDQGSAGTVLGRAKRPKVER